MKSGIATIIAGAVLFIPGAFFPPLVFLVLVVLEYRHEVQFEVPGIQEVSVEKPGRYYLWNDYQTVYAGRSYNQSEHIPGGMQIDIRDSDGNLLPFTSDTSMSSTGDGSAKNTIGYVEVIKPGKVKVDVSGGSDERIFSFGPTDLARMFFLLPAGLVCQHSLDSPVLDSEFGVSSNC